MLHPELVASFFVKARVVAVEISTPPRRSVKSFRRSVKSFEGGLELQYFLKNTITAFFQVSEGLVRALMLADVFQIEIIQEVKLG